MKTQLRNLYLDWFNNWLTIDAFCDHHEIARRDAIAIIEMGRRYHEEFCLEMQEFA